MIKKISITLTIFAMSYVFLLAYATSTLSFEYLVVCATNDNGKPLRHEMCEFYFYNLTDERDAAELNEGAGISFANEIPDEQDRQKTIQRLLSLGLDINGISKHSGLTALNAAIVKEDPALVDYLLSVGADKDIKDEYGRNAFDYATLLSDSNNKVKMLEILKNN